MKTRLVLALLFLGASSRTSMVMAQSPGTFTATGNMATARYFHTATLLTTGKVLIAGGTQIVGLLASAKLYDPSTGKFTATGNMSVARYGHTATLLPNGKVLIAGGNTPQNGALAAAELFDPSTGIFVPTGSMTTARDYHTATLLNDGRVLIAGGSDGDNQILASAELYDPAAGTFAPTGGMLRPKYFAQATVLANGKVLIDGLGSDDSSTAELYDPAAGTFSLTGAELSSYTFPRTADLLPNGKVLETLDVDCDVSDGAEVYDPASGVFTETGRMTAWRTERTSTLLPDGTVLIAGGGDNALATPFTYFYLAHSGAELYDPAAGMFTPTGHMTVGRTTHTATLLPDGTVLMAGGRDAGAAENTAELFHPKLLIPAPGLLSLSGDGQGQGAIQHAGTVRIASATDPAVAGEYLSIYLVGLADGSLIPPQVAIGGRLAEITFFGSVSAYPGLDVINVRMPQGVAPGNAVPVRLTYLGRPSNQVSIGVQ